MIILKIVDLISNQLGDVEIYMFNTTQWSNQQMLQFDFFKPILWIKKKPWFVVEVLTCQKYSIKEEFGQ